MLAGAAAPAQTFTFKTLKVPKSFTTNAQALLPNGNVIGYYFDDKLALHGFIESAGTYKTVNVSGSAGTLLVNANSTTLLGQTLNGATAEGFTMNASGTMTKVEFPGALSTYPTGINDAGTIVGHYIPSSGVAEETGFVLRDGTYTTFAVPNSFDTEASGVNNSGTIVGSYRLLNSNTFSGFVYANGKFTTINYPGAYQTIVSGINDAGVSVGYYATGVNTGNIGFVFDGTNCTSFDPPNAANAYTFTISNAGDVVGFVILTSGSEVGFVGIP